MGDLTSFSRVHALYAAYKTRVRKLARALLALNSRQRLVIAQLTQVVLVTFLSFSCGVFVANLMNNYRHVLLLLLALPVIHVLSGGFDAHTGPRLEPPPARHRRPKKNRYLSHTSTRSFVAPSTASTSEIQSAAVDKDAWKADVGAPAVEKAWAIFGGSIVQEFIYDTWYSSLTPDKEFPASIRAMLNANFGRLAKRAKRVNLVLLASQALELVGEQIEIFRDTKDELRYGEAKWVWEDASDDLNDKMLRMQLKKECNLHPAMRTQDGHYKVLKQLAEVAVGHLDLQGDKVLSHVVSRELLAGTVFRKLIQLCTCRNVQSWMLMLVDWQMAREVSVDVSRPSDEMRGVWAQMQKISHYYQEESNQAVGKASSQDEEDDGLRIGEGQDGVEVGASEGEGSVVDRDEGEAGSSTTTATNTATAATTRTAKPTSRFRGQPVATVVAAEIVNATGSFLNSAFVVYSIRVGDDRGEWTVSRRYRHFEQLHRALRSLNLNGFDAELPSKRYFYRDFTPSYVEARRVALNEYLQQVLGNPALCASEPVWEFFKKRSDRFQVTDSVGTMFKHTFDNVIGVTSDVTRIGHTAGKGVTKGVAMGVTKMSNRVGRVGRVGRDLLFSGASRRGPGTGVDGRLTSPASPNSPNGTAHSIDPSDMQLMEDEINMGHPGHRISPAYFSAEGYSDLGIDSVSDSGLGAKGVNVFDDDDDDDGDGDDVLDILMRPAESVAGSLYDLIDSIFMLQDRGFFRRQVFAVYRRLVCLLFGNGIDEVAAAYIADLREPSTVARLIAKIQSLLWPGGKFVKSDDGHRKEVTVEKYLEPLPSPPDDAQDITSRLRVALSDGPTSVLSKLVGRLAFYAGVDDVMSILSSQTMLLQIAYGLMELVLDHLFDGGPDDA